MLSKLKEVEFSDDVYDQTLADANDGFMSDPVPLDEVDLDEVSLTRRIPVRELRAKGWRTRVVDHFTESETNPAVEAVDKVKHDSVCLLVWL